jgi:hypothetical protein
MHTLDPARILLALARAAELNAIDLDARAEIYERTADLSTAARITRLHVAEEKEKARALKAEAARLGGIS